MLHARQFSTGKRIGVHRRGQGGLMKLKYHVNPSNLAFSLAVLICISFTTTAIAQDLFVFPAKGQDNAQMDRDKADCFIWAKNQVGYDPLQSSQVASQTPINEASPKGTRLKGAAVGAAAGAVIGGIADDDAGKGAAIGAASGALFGGVKKRRGRRNQQQARQEMMHQQAKAEQTMKDAFNRAYTACLEGKGYTVK